MKDKKNQMAEDPFENEFGGGFFSPIKPAPNTQRTLFFDDEDFAPQKPVDEGSWKRIPQTQVFQDSSQPILIVKTPRSSGKAGDSTFVVQVSARNLPGGTKGSFFLEMIPWSLEGSSKEMGDIFDQPEEGEVAGFHLPLVNDPEFNTQFYVKEKLIDTHVLFKMDAGIIGQRWMFSIPEYAYIPPDMFTLAVDDGTKIGDGEPLLNVVKFNQPIIECKVCGSPTNKRCKVCKGVHYCDDECRDKDWPTHKHTCTRNF